MEKESEKKIAEIEVQMQVNKDKSLADAAFYKALKEAESDKVITRKKIYNLNSNLSIEFKEG